MAEPFGYSGNILYRGERGLAAAGNPGELLGLLFFEDRAIDRTRGELRRWTARDRVVELRKLAFAEELGQRVIAFRAQGNQEQPARGLVEPVHHAELTLHADVL